VNVEDASRRGLKIWRDHVIWPFNTSTFLSSLPGAFVLRVERPFSHFIVNDSLEVPRGEDFHENDLEQVKRVKTSINATTASIS
jgi:hypothetical protein